MKRRIITLVIFLLLSSLTFLYPRLAPSFASLKPGIEPQQRRGQTGRRARRPARPARPRVDYSRFNHSRPEHRQKSCDSCHIIWAIEEKSKEMTSDSLDIKDYPEHESCLDCHRQQFFRGARPVICSNCHNVVSPRSDSRFEFPKKNETSEFDNVFPHASHVKSTMLGQFKKISGPNANLQSSCNYCHKVNTTAFKPAKGAPADAFAPPAGTFMTTPSSHVTCFQCHFQKGVENRETPPLATECVKCHTYVAAASATPTPKLAPTPVKKATATGSVAPVFAIVPISMQASPKKSPVAAATPKPVAQKPSPAPTPIAAHKVQTVAWPERIVLKFAHDKDAHKKRTNDDGKEVAITCLQCHTAARKAETLADMRKKESKVQLSSCSSSGCHTATSGTAQLGLSLYRELRERGKELKPNETKFECVFCHTRPYSTAETPCSHYAAVLASATKEKKSTKGIEQLTPKQCVEEQKK